MADPKIFPEGKPIKKDSIFPEGSPIPRDMAGSGDGPALSTTGPTAFTERLSEFGGEVVDTVKEGIERVPKRLGQVSKGAYDFMNEAHEASPDTGPMTNTFDIGKKVISGLIGAGTVAQEKWDELGPNEKKALIVRLGATTAATIATGGQSLLIQALAASTGNLVGGEISEEMGYEEDTPLFSKAKMKEAGAGFVEGFLLTKLLSATGKGLQYTGEKTRGASVPLADKKLAALDKPGAMTGLTTVGKNTGGEMHLVKDMKAGEKTMAKVLLDEFPDTIKNADEFGDALNMSLKARRQTKASLVTNFDRALQSSKGQVRDFTLKDVGLPRVQKQIAELKKTGVSSDVIADLENFKNEMADAFSKPMGQGIGGRLYTRKSFGEMQDLLDGIYKKQRRLKAFDDNMLSKQGVNPSANTNAEAIKIYGEAGADIRKAIQKKAAELERKGHLSKGSAQRLADTNQEIHDLMPWKDGSDRFSYADYQTTKQPQPGSLMQPPGSNFSNGQSLKSMATDTLSSPITGPIVERARVNAALEFAPETYASMQDAAGLTLGRLNTPNIQGQGLTGRVIGPGEEMAGQAMSSVAASGAPLVGANVGVQAPIPVIMQKDQMDGSIGDFERSVSDPLSMEQIENDPNIPPEVLESIQQSKNGTMYEKLRTFGKLKIATRNLGYFPPPPMQGIYSYTATPGSEYRGQKVLGVITDESEAHIYLDAINQIPDIEKRTRLKSAFNSPGKYVLEIPTTLKAIPTPEPKKKSPAPEPKEPESSTAAINMDGGATEMERVVHDY